MKHNIFWIFIVFGFLFTSCSGLRRAQLNSQFAHSNCNQQNVYSYSIDDLPKPIFENDLDTTLNAMFSFRSLIVANAIGILDDLVAYVNTQQEVSNDPTVERRLDFIELSQKINQRINISSLEISAISSEIDCEEERADQVVSYLKGKEDDIETKLTVGAIIVGAAGAIAAGILLANEDSGSAPEFIGIGAGLTEATLGLMILLNKRKVEFYHPRNALSEIWEGKETSTMFPPSVWHYLNYYNPHRPDEPSLRYQIVERWMNFGQISIAKRKKKRDLIDIYFGEGGKYTAEQLDNRANMLDQLEAQINLMKQDLKALALEVEKTKIDR